MSTSKKKQTALARRLANDAWCIYCGGNTPAETLDHAPPVVAFDRRHRPKGLEFPACNACNQGAKRSDQVVGFMARVYPDAPDPADLLRILGGIENNFPGLLRELWPTPQQEHRLADALPAELQGQAHALNVSGPIVTQHMHRFVARMGLALHYEATGRIVRPEGGVGVRWYSNFDTLRGAVPPDLMQFLGPAATLSAGRFDVADQFLYASRIVEDNERIGLHVFTFRVAFAAFALTSETGTALQYSPPTHLFRPGFLKSGLEEAAA